MPHCLRSAQNCKEGDASFKNTRAWNKILFWQEKKEECCSAHMFDALVAITDFLKAGGHTHGVMFGTLLGAVRSNGIIPYTADVDIHVSDSGIKALKEQTAIPYNFKFERSLVRGCAAFPNQPRSVWSGGPTHRSSPNLQYYIDIYSWGNIANYQSHCDFKNMEGQVEIFGKSFRAPKDPDRCLKYMYGNDYMKAHQQSGNDVTKDHTFARAHEAADKDKFDMSELAQANRWLDEAKSQVVPGAD